MSLAQIFQKGYRRKANSAFVQSTGSDQARGKPAVLRGGARLTCEFHPLVLDLLDRLLLPKQAQEPSSKSLLQALPAHGHSSLKVIQKNQERRVLVSVRVGGSS